MCYSSNLESEKIHYQTAAKQARIDIAPFRDGIIKAVEKLASKIHTFQSIGIKFRNEKDDSYDVSRGSGEARTTIRDIVERMLLPRIEKVKAGGTWDKEQTQDSLWYNALPLFEECDVNYSNDSRQWFKKCIRDLCKEDDIAREEIGIIVAPWGYMFYKGQWLEISFDTVQDLAKKGTDIVFIEKRDIVRALGEYASSVGVALVNTHGILSDYTEDLAELADRSGAHISLLTDYDIPGLLIAAKLSQDVPRLGVDERMLDHFGISKENKMIVIPYSARKHRLGPDKLRALVENDIRFNSEDVDIDWLKDNKIEIDAILAEVGPERLWQYLQDLLEEEFPNRDYRRVINPKPDLSKHYHPIIHQLSIHYDNYAHEITKEESKNIEENELKDVDGFIDVEEKENEIQDRLGKIVKEDKHLTEVAEALVALDKEKGYKITEEADEIQQQKDGVSKSGSPKDNDIISAGGYVPKPQLAELLEHSKIDGDYYPDNSKLWVWWNSEPDDDSFDYFPPGPAYRPEYKEKAEKYYMRYDEYLEWQIIKENGSEKELLRQILTSREKDLESALRSIYGMTLIRERHKFLESKLRKREADQGDEEEEEEEGGS